MYGVYEYIIGWYQSYSGQSSCSKCPIGSAGTAVGNVACAPWYLGTTTRLTLTIIQLVSITHMHGDGQ